MTALPTIEAPGPEASQETLIAHLRYCRERRARIGRDRMAHECLWCLRYDAYDAVSYRVSREREPLFCSSLCLEAYNVATKAMGAAERNGT
jgi:hypothetical protein